MADSTRLELATSPSGTRATLSLTYSDFVLGQQLSYESRVGGLDETRTRDLCRDRAAL